MSSIVTIGELIFMNVVLEIFNEKKYQKDYELPLLVIYLIRDQLKCDLLGCDELGYTYNGSLCRTHRLEWLWCPACDSNRKRVIVKYDSHARLREYRRILCDTCGLGHRMEIVLYNGYPTYQKTYEVYKCCSCNDLSKKRIMSSDEDCDEGPLCTCITAHITPIVTKCNKRAW